MFFVYILQSVRRKRFYIGVSANVGKRLQEHNAGYTKSTKPYRPWRLIYSEAHPSKTKASKREWHLKHPAGYLEKRSIIEQYAQ
ncbi:hypothetical protein A3A39_01310 [Candidatus Kaiserbacteria bacterium RIFCSPLOWO2_01_FULL_54_13]|uniref:GIY-YIG domain-containing protein n=1 Tax=Candidatus Kaiserbacteria bacterium RIFCSPLOWO2_01_FULL_54_13 TaxID=1798512 RepID=A0A1F6F2A6_9BACT|nr:MAG: hypothetical protein A3A39_01310 [Candidatus Kaiserbacteria bacterium RIFCSPLOWO2_01_FULL_54_13]